MARQVFGRAAETPVVPPAPVEAAIGSGIAAGHGLVWGDRPFGVLVNVFELVTGERAWAHEAVGALPEDLVVALADLTVVSDASVVPAVTFAAGGPTDDLRDGTGPLFGSFTVSDQVGAARDGGPTFESFAAALSTFT